MNLYLYLAKFCSVLSYIFAMIFAETERFKAVNFTFLNKLQIDLSVLEIFLYTDILIGIFAIIYSLFVYKIKKENPLKSLVKKCDFLTLFLLLISISSSICKSFLANNFLPSEVGFFDLIVPIGTFIFSILFLREKVEKKHFLAFFICFIGVSLYTLSKEKVILNLKIQLIAYFIMKSLSGIGERRLSKERSLNEAFSIDNIIYAVFGILILFFFQEKEIGNITLKKFNIKYIFSLPIFLVFILSNFNHLFTIISHKREKLMTGFLIKGISAIFINISLTYLFFNKIINIYQFLSIIIIIFGLYVFKKK